MHRERNDPVGDAHERRLDILLSEADCRERIHSQHLASCRGGASNTSSAKAHLWWSFQHCAICIAWSYMRDGQGAAGVEHRCTDSKQWHTDRSRRMRIFSTPTPRIPLVIQYRTSPRRKDDKGNQQRSHDLSLAYALLPNRAGVHGRCPMRPAPEHRRRSLPPCLVGKARGQYCMGSVQPVVVIIAPMQRSKPRQWAAAIYAQGRAGLESRSHAECRQRAPHSSGLSPDDMHIVV